MLVPELFAAVGLAPQGPVPWGTRVPERRCGVYVVVGADEVVYVGQTKRPLQVRVREYYRTSAGRWSNYRGGQRVRQLSCPLSVYWSPADQPLRIEGEMLRIHKEREGRLPFANDP